MLNVTNTDELIKMLVKTTHDYKSNRTVVENVKSSMFKNYGILRGETQRIFNGELSFEKMDKNNLIRFTIELYNEIGLNKLSPYQYFSDKEIETAKKEEALKEEVEKFPIKIVNTIQIDESTYVAFVDARILVKLYNSNLLDYNYNINKKYKLISNVEGKIIQALDINSLKVKEIADKIANGTYRIDKVVLNILVGSSLDREAGKEVTYHKEDRILLIHQAQVDIVDGLHDISALMVALNNNSALEIKVEVEIKHLELSKIKAYFNKLNIKGGVN
jgi:hypothetical protein